MPQSQLKVGQLRLAAEGTNPQHLTVPHLHLSLLMERCCWETDGTDQQWPMEKPRREVVGTFHPHPSAPSRMSEQPNREVVGIFLRKPSLEQCSVPSQLLASPQRAEEETILQRQLVAQGSYPSLHVEKPQREVAGRVPLHLQTAYQPCLRQAAARSRQAVEVRNHSRQPLADVERRGRLRLAAAETNRPLATSLAQPQLADHTHTQVLAERSQPIRQLATAERDLKLPQATGLRKGLTRGQ